MPPPGARGRGAEKGGGCREGAEQGGGPWRSCGRRRLRGRPGSVIFTTGPFPRADPDGAAWLRSSGRGRGAVGEGGGGANGAEAGDGGGESGRGGGGETGHVSRRRRSSGGGEAGRRKLHGGPSRGQLRTARPGGGAREGDEGPRGWAEEVRMARRRATVEGSPVAVAEGRSGTRRGGGGASLRWRNSAELRGVAEKEKEKERPAAVAEGSGKKGGKVPPVAQLVRHPLAMLALVPSSVALFAAGAGAGAVAKMVTAPLDRVKLLMQTHSVRVAGESTKKGIGFLEHCNSIMADLSSFMVRECSDDTLQSVENSVQTYARDAA